MAEALPSRLVDAMKSCLTSGDYSDLAIKCGDDMYKVHKLIVCTRSEFFARAVKFGGKETQENLVDLSDDDPKVISSLIRYLYTDEYDSELSGPPDSERKEPRQVPTMIVYRTELVEPWVGHKYTYEFPHTCVAIDDPGNNSVLCPHHTCNDLDSDEEENFICDECCTFRVMGKPSHLLNHSKMYQIADKYSVVGLKELSRKSFRHCCYDFWNDDAFHIAVDHAFSTTPSSDLGLRSFVIDTISQHMGLIRKPEIRRIMAKHSDLAIGVLLRNAEILE